ncbi:MAG: amidohydrolase family protein [Thermodesulfovibrionales bacterium]|nr:amidohydrolase family protein [Thermodesulfovibrionales bacterium]
MIDIHIHGLNNLDTSTNSVEDILTMATILKRRGITGFLPTLYSNSMNEMRRQMALITQAISQQTQDHSQILGIHLEGPFLNPNKAGALNSSSFIQPSEYALKALLEGFKDIVKIITIAPEIEGSLKVIKMIRDMGIVVSLGHSDATFYDAQKAYNAGAQGITHLFNAMRGFHHREPGLAGFGLLNADIYIEVIADNFHLHDETLNMIFKMKNKERILIISDSVAFSDSSKDGIRNKEGTLMGGANTLDESIERLKRMGITDESISLAVNDNQRRYLFKT